MRITRHQRHLSGVLALILGGLTVLCAGPASGATSIETMPLSRLQIRITTGSTGTDDPPAVRLNAGASGVRWLNPPSRSAFDAGHVDTYDLRLVSTPSEITMLRLGVASAAGWCVKKVELLFNNRLAFARNTVNGTGCATITGGTYVEFSSAALRTDPLWSGYGTPPPLPAALGAADFRKLVTDVTGTAMVAEAGVAWDPASSPAVTRKTATSVRVAHGLRVSDPSGIESPSTVQIAYDIQLFVGTDTKLHATKSNATCCYHYGISDAVVTQVDTALSRMTAHPVPHDPLRFSVDVSPGVTWAYVPALG
jgi:hypothetical protein